LLGWRLEQIEAAVAGFGGGVVDMGDGRMMAAVAEVASLEHDLGASGAHLPIQKGLFFAVYTSKAGFWACKVPGNYGFLKGMSRGFVCRTFIMWYLQLQIQSKQQKRGRGGWVRQLFLVGNLV